jgi:ATP-dependent DNA helicase RecQ
LAVRADFSSSLCQGWFGDFGVYMLEQAQRVLKDIFGYDSFRGRQAAIIERVASGGDALVLMPTGGGKSLCFQVPALLRPAWRWWCRR